PPALRLASFLIQRDRSAPTATAPHEHTPVGLMIPPPRVACGGATERAPASFGRRSAPATAGTGRCRHPILDQRLSLSPASPAYEVASRSDLPTQRSRR